MGPREGNCWFGVVTLGPYGLKRFFFTREPLSVILETVETFGAGWVVRLAETVQVGGSGFSNVFSSGAWLVFRNSISADIETIFFERRWISMLAPCRASCFWDPWRNSLEAIA